MNTSSNNFMKAKINVIAFVGSMLLAMASCNNQECQMTTVVNSDGSCSRDIALHLDSTQLVTGKISQDKNCVDIGKNWKLSCLLYTSPSPRDRQKSRMPSSA